MNPRATIVTVSDLHLMLYDQDMKPRAIALSVLSNITNNFSEERIIGSGGFADVYKGIVEHDLVAVKKITEECMDDKEYNRELECLLSVKHKNIVRFIGYCGNTELDMRMEEGAIVNSNKEKRLLCFEYVPKGNLDDLIKDPSTGLAWRNRYKIIKGICEGLSYLHQINILHLDLKPGNILLGENEVPKITDFGLSRYFTGDKTCVTTTKFGGTMGYMAPEHSSKEITPKFDLYSLGVIIIELITGKKGCPVVDNVIESWKNRVDTSEQKTELKQIRVCIDIGIACIDANPAKRPDSMKHIMDKLAKMECVPVITAEGGQNLLLDVHTRVLYFPFESNKVIPCSLDLKNNTNEHVAFKLMRRGNKYGPCFVRLPMYGLVPPMSTYTLILTTEWRSELERINISMILESKILGDEHIQKFQSQPESIFENFKEMGNEVREVKLIAVYTTQQRSSKILDMSGWFEPTLYSLDTNLVKQWVIIGGSRGHVEIWNYHTQIKVDSLRLSAERAVTCVKFIARKQWFVAATERGDIHVYNYRSKIQAIMSLSAGYEDGCLVSLVVHPTQPYLLTVSGQEMKLWNWDKGWECVRIYTHRLCSKIYQVAFNQEDTIAIASEKHEVEIRSLDSGEGDYKLLSGHSNRVNCLHFFTSHGQEYLVTGSTDKSAKIWDMEEKICVRTLQTLSPVMYVLYQPSLEILITGSKDGLLYLWSTAKSRLEKIIYFGYGGDVHSLTSFTGRVVIGKEQTVAIIDIEDNNYVDESKDYGEEAVVTTSVRLGYKTQELLDVHPLELHFHRGSHNTSSLHLTNKTDEHVVFRVTYNYDMWSQCFINLPLYGTVAPGSTCRLVVATDREDDLSREVDMVLESSILGGNNLVVLTGQLECHTFISKAKEFGHWVHEVALKLFYTPTERETTGATRPPPKITGNPYCLDAHPTKPWVITGYDRELRIWNFDSQELVHTIELSEETVERVKFDLREQWIVAQTFYGSIHVYDCACVSQIKKIATFRAPVDTAPRYLLLAIHPTKPHVLTLSDSSMELWDGDKDWECTQIFGPGDIRQCAFNLKDPNSFATGSLQPVVKIWSLDTYKCEYVLYGHSESVNCLAYFASGGRQYLITGSNDCTAKIWDLQERACIHTIAVFMCPVIHAISIPGHPYLVTCSENATIHWWSSTDFRLGGTINLITYGRVHGLVLLTGSRRIAVGQSKAMTILSIDEDEKAAASEGSNKDSTCEMG